MILLSLFIEISTTITLFLIILISQLMNFINLITLLVGAEESGLEVRNPNGDWIPIDAKSKSIVCNIGDMMQLVTDKHLVSTTHRVIQDLEQESKARYSIPFFLHPAPSVTLKSVFRENDDGILADDFLDERLKAIKLY